MFTETNIRQRHWDKWAKKGSLAPKQPASAGTIWGSVMRYHNARDSLDPKNLQADLVVPQQNEHPRGIVPRSRSRPGLGVNDGPADDFIAVAEGWESESGASLIGASPPPQPAVTLDMIAGQIAPAQMRQLGSSLLKLADAIDDQWNPDEVRATYHWLTQAGRIERQAIKLAQVATRMRAISRRRCRHLSGEWFGEPAWEMLLELFIQFAGGARVSTKCLVIASGAPDTTALRVIDRLVESGLVERAPSQTDKRVTLINLTREGVVAVGMVLTEAEA